MSVTLVERKGCGTLKKKKEGKRENQEKKQTNGLSLQGQERRGAGGGADQGDIMN